MADRKISELNPALAGNLHDAALVHVVDLTEAAPADRNVQATMAQLKTAFGVADAVPLTVPTVTNAAWTDFDYTTLTKLYFWRSADRTVHIQGAIFTPDSATWNSAWSSDDFFILFTLPVGCRPSWSVPLTLGPAPAFSGEWQGTVDTFGGVTLGYTGVKPSSRSLVTIQASFPAVIP